MSGQMRYGKRWSNGLDLKPGMRPIAKDPPCAVPGCTRTAPRPHRSPLCAACHVFGGRRPKALYAAYVAALAAWEGARTREAMDAAQVALAAARAALVAPSIKAGETHAANIRRLELREALARAKERAK